MRKGFTLVETVTGLATIGTAFYLLIAVFINLAPRSVRVDNLNKKAHLAQEKIEEVLARPFSQVASIAPASFAGNFSNYEYRVVVNYVAAGDLNTPVAGPTAFKNVKVKVWGGTVDLPGTLEIVTLAASYEL